MVLSKVFLIVASPNPLGKGAFRVPILAAFSLYGEHRACQRSILGLGAFQVIVEVYH